MSSDLVQQAADKLLKISFEANSLQRDLENAYGELTPEILSKLALLDYSRAETIDFIDHTRNKLKHNAQFYRAQARANDAIASRYEKNDEFLAAREKAMFAELNVTEMRGEFVRHTLVEKPDKLVIEDENKIPLDYFKEELVLKVDKESIRIALEKGCEVPGARLEKVVALCPYPIVHDTPDKPKKANKKAVKAKVAETALDPQE